MKCIVPLAGPDLYTEKFGWRPLVQIDGRSLIERALEGRAWRAELASSDFVFVLRNMAGIETVTEHLGSVWPGCGIATVSTLTQGALYSVLAAASLMPPDEPIIIDLADILFSEGPATLGGLFADHHAVVPIFDSSDPAFSYLRCAGGRVVEACEKQVISNNASAGVYGFRNLPVLLEAAAHSIANRASYEFRGNLFVCPMINGVIAKGGNVACPQILNVDLVSKIFK